MATGALQPHPTIPSIPSDTAGRLFTPYSYLFEYLEYLEPCSYLPEFPLMEFYIPQMCVYSQGQGSHADSPPLLSECLPGRLEEASLPVSRFFTLLQPSAMKKRHNFIPIL